MAMTRLPTVGEQIVVHLFQFARVQDEYVVPPGLAQAGIADSLGITRAHAAIELKRQMAVGRIEVRVAHVAGERTRRKVYRLTPKGATAAEAVRGRALRRTIELVLPGGRIESHPGPRAMEILRQRGVPEAQAILLLLTRSRVDAREAAPPPIPAPIRRAIRSPEARARAAFERTFVRPYAWQVAVAQGPPNAPPVAVAA